MTRNVADRKHWRALADEKKRWHYLIRAEAGNIKAAEPCRVTITFRTMRQNDKDNLHARCKSPLDALQRCGIITNDDPDTITLEVKQDLVKHRNECGTLIEISELLPFDEPQQIEDDERLHYLVAAKAIRRLAPRTASGERWKE